MTELARMAAPSGLDPSLPRFDSLVEMLHTSVGAAPDNTAVIYEDRSISYAEFGRAVNGLARRLESLRGRDGRIVVLMRNSIEMDVALMAVMQIGGQVAPINPFFTAGELENVLPGIEADVILTDSDSHEKAEGLAGTAGVEHVLMLGERGLDLGEFTGDTALSGWPAALPRADDLALLIFTGGSTGVPKGVDHTHAGLMMSLLQHVTVWPLEFGAETFLNVAPMFHIWGLAYSAWVPIYTRGTLVLIPKYDPDVVVEELGRHRVSVFAGGPAPIYMGLLGSELFDGTDLAALKYCPSGGAPCPGELHREWGERTGLPLLEGWGMTEGAPFCLNRAAAGGRRKHSVGYPVPETEVAIVDVETGTRVLERGQTGEVKVRGPQLMVGYRNHPEETARTLRDGWVHTGDIGYIDDDGFVFLVDRKKDMVLVGGYNVYPREIDEILFRHPKVREAATVGRPDSRLGEVLVAFVVAVEPLTEDEFFAYCKEAMVKYKRPVDVHFVEALPKTRTNKINRIELREMLARMAEKRA